MKISPQALELLRSAAIPAEFLKAAREFAPSTEVLPPAAPEDFPGPAEMERPPVERPMPEMPTEVWPEEFPEPQLAVPIEPKWKDVSWMTPEVLPKPLTEVGRKEEAGAIYLTDLTLNLSGVKHMTPGLLQLTGLPIDQLMLRFAGDGGNEDEDKGNGKAKGNGKVVTIPETSQGTIPPKIAGDPAIPGWCVIAWILTGAKGGHKHAQGATDWGGFNKALGTPTQQAVDSIAKDIREANKIFKASPCTAMQLDLCKVYVLDTSKVVAPDQPGGGTKKLAELVFTNGIVYGESDPDPIDWLFVTLEVHFRAEFNRQCIHLFYANDVQQSKANPDLPGIETKGYSKQKNSGAIGEPYTPMGVVEGDLGRNIAHEVIHSTGHEFHVKDKIPAPDDPIDEKDPTGPKNKDSPDRMKLIDNMKKVDDEYKKDTSSDQDNNIMQKTYTGDRILPSQCKIIQDFAHKFLEPCRGK
ncbi:hypothetical protein [Nitrosomonas sp. Nm166]|uniref:hypothetical protein n=1 Tax=Nitrosomonas sp. Nm166 TaxID=1881054 RepID=UPI0011607640|nr:hypothetical protein [Nitrosomonas sp. Nm166]